MLDTICGGTLIATPSERTGQSGKPFATATIRCAQDNGDPALFVHVIAFADAVRAALLALAAGDSLTVSGPLSISVWTPSGGEARPQVKIVAQAVLTAYHVRRKRDAMQGYTGPREQRRPDGPAIPAPDNLKCTAL
ncbi:single-stranded DNA-binding protein [Cupriavidus metallidurans]|uniref:single-stranded DNA-binding protein n=1 Tax=Cupriavidus metallidurans TaxID=119219 RepID=UPI003CFFF7E6